MPGVTPRPRHLAVLDRGHNRPGSPHGGSTPDGRREVDLVAQYQDAAAELLRSRGVEVLILGRGELEPYASRWAQAIEAARKPGIEAAVYASLHLNAGGGHMPIVFFDRRSMLGRRCAEQVADGIISCALTAPHPAHTWACYDDSAEPGKWLYNPYFTIRGIGDPGTPRHLCGLCVEPAFMDQPAHQRLLTPEGLGDMGRAVGLGLWWALAGRDA